MTTAPEGNRNTPPEPGSFLRDTVRNALGSILLFGGRFIAIAIIARSLGVEAFGVVVLAILAADLLVMLMLAGLPGVIARFLPVISADDWPRFAALRRNWLLLSSGGLMLTGPLLAHFVLDLHGILIALFVFWVVISAVQAVSLAEIQGTLQFDLVVWACGLGALAFVAGAGFVTLFPSLTTVFLVMAAVPLAQLIPWFILARRNTTPSRDSEMPPRRDVFLYGVNVCFIGALTAVVWSRGELFVVEEQLGELALGHYGAAVTLTAMVWRLTGLLQGAVTPHISRRLKSEEGAGPFLADVSRLTMTIAAIAALGIALFGAELVLLVFGNAYVPTASILAVMAPGIAMAGTLTVTLGVQLMSNARVPRNALAFGAVALLGGAYLLAGWYEAEGAATARMLTMCGVSAAMPLWLIWQGSGALGRQILLELIGTVLLVSIGSALALFGGLDLASRAVIWLVTSYAILVRATGGYTPQAMVRRTLGILRAL